MRVDNSIYMDYQATTPMDERVLQEMLPYMQNRFGNPHSADHQVGWAASTAVEASKNITASFLGAMPDEIIFTSGATESNNMAIAGAVLANKSPRRKILISSIEHKCVKEAAIFYSEKLGYVVEEIPVYSTGEIDTSAYKNMLDDTVLLVSIAAVNNEIGVIQDIKSLSEQAHDYGAMFHSDAAQAPEAQSIDVFDWDVDMLSVSAHKMYGPKGIGALYISGPSQHKVSPMIRGGGQQGGLRSGTVPTFLCVGFAAAVKIVEEHGESNRARLKDRSNHFLRTLSKNRIKFQLNGHPDKRHPGNVNIEFPGVNADLLIELIRPNICASLGSACNSGLIQGSYTLRALGKSEEQANSSIRFSLGRFTENDQIEEAVDLIGRSISRISSNDYKSPSY